MDRKREGVRSKRWKVTKRKAVIVTVVVNLRFV